MKGTNIKLFNKVKYRFRVKPIVLAMATILPSSVLADIVVDVNDPQRLNIASAANGTPLININDPNNKGVSHNKYADFNVSQQGVIFNNSMQDGVTQTGGYAMKNANLSAEASVILNEVTGVNGSQLAGSMEVFGRTADLIVANERGITVNGVSTVNASNLTLSTGKVNIDQSGNVQLAVERGNISVEGAGINTDGLGYFDIVSRSATLSGEIAGNADVKVVTGLNDYDTSSRAHSVRSRTGSDTPKVAISGTQLGSMYGNRIQLISTESGAGVTHQGSIVGNNSIEITADGEISLAAAVSKNESVTLAGKSIALNSYAGVGGISAHNDVILTALAATAINADVIAATGVIRINANSLLQSAANLLAQGGARSTGAVPAIQINVADRYVISGTLYAVDSSGNKIAGAQVSLSNGKYSVKVGATTLTDATVMSDANVVSTSGDIAVTAGTVENHQGIVAARKGSLTFTLKDAMVNNGSVEANGSIVLSGQKLKNGGVFTTSDRLKLTIGTFENTGSFYAGKIGISAHSADNQGIIISDDGDISLEVEGGLANSGTVQASNNIGLNAGKLNNQGTVNAAKNVELTLTDLENSGAIQGGNVTSSSDKLTNSGKVIATSGDISLKINGNDDAVNSGTIQASDAIKVAGKTVRNEGSVNAQSGSLTLNLDDTLDNSGALYGNNINIATHKLNNSGEAISEEGHLSVEINELINSGILQAQSGQITSAGKLLNQGSIATVKDLQITAENISNSKEIISHGNMTLTIDGELNNMGGAAIISAGQDLSITGGALAVNNNEGAVIQSTGGDITLTGARSLNNSDAKIQANGTLKIADTTEVNNSGGQLEGTHIRLEDIDVLRNLAGATVIADDSLTITDVNQLENNESTLSAINTLTIESVKSILNTAAQISAGGNVSLTDVNLLENADGAQISSLYRSVLLTTLEKLKNISGSVVEAAQLVSISGAKEVQNSDDALIQSSGDVTLQDINTLNNAGSIMTQLNMILQSVDYLVNSGEYALLQGLNIIISKVSSVVNQDYAAIIADNNLKINEVTDILNKAAGFIQANNISIAADSFTNTGYDSQIVGLESSIFNVGKLSNNDQAGIFSDGRLSIFSDEIINALESNISAKNYSISAASLTNRGVISSDSTSGDSAFLTTTFDNIDGRVINRDNLSVSATNFKNSGEGYISGTQSLTLNLQGDYSNAEGTLISTKQLNLNATGNLSIDKRVESYGSLNFSGKNIYNNEAIVSAGDIYLTATNIVNNTNSLIYSMGDTFLKATDKIYNKIKGNILSQQRIIMEAGTIHNEAGVIRSEGDMWLDADKILNESTYTGGEWDTGPIETGTAEYEEGGPTWSKYHIVKINMVNVSSDLKLDTRAEISSGNNIYINQDMTTPGEVENRGGLIQAKQDIHIRGNLINAPKYSDMTMLDYLKSQLKEKIVFTFTSIWFMGDNESPQLEFNSVYQMLDFVYNNGVDNYGNYTKIDDDSRSKFSSAMQQLGSSHYLLNSVMNRLFGEQWKAMSFSALQVRWSELNEAIALPVPDEGDTSVPDSGEFEFYSGKIVRSSSTSKLENMKIYSLPADKAAIVAGKNFVHTDGSFNNGIDTELAEDVIKNQTVTVDVGEEQVTTLEQGYEVKFSQKNIAEISMGISSLPTISVLTEIKGLFEKSQSFIDYLSTLSKQNSSTQAADSGNVQTGAERTNRVIPMYETRPSMIDQSQYYGSDYFFNSVGYNSEKPVIVIGDNYFISELIRRQVNESIGTYYAQKYSLEGSDMVKMLYDNAGKVAASEEGASLVIGQALTQEQRDNLTEDIVWFVTEKIDGVEVMVPVIYLAQATITEIDTANKTGAAIVHAGSDVVVDADNINNTNAVISAGNNVTLVAEGDINNISSGMNAGIYAGGSASLVSESGNITNSGSAIAADKDVNLIAEKGNVEIVASVGRDERGDQLISAYDDGISAGGNMNIQGENVDITGIALTGGESEDSVVRVAATEGNVNFNDVHEVKSSYKRDFKSDGWFTTRTEETTEASAISKTSSVNTGGAFVVEAAQDAVFTGGEYNAGSGSIKAEGDVTFKTSQDHSFKETKITESSLVFGAKTDIPFLDAKEYNASTLTENDVSDADYNPQGPDGSMSNSNTKRPGAAALADSASFKAGLQTTETTTTESSTTNKNASFNFTKGVDIAAGKTLDIGGMDLAVGADATANLSGNDIISTKYEDVHKTTVETKETFIGVKGEGHSAVADTVNKTINRIEKNTDGMVIDEALTAAEYGGDISNVFMNDAVGGSVSAGWSETKTSSSSETRSQNINNISGGTINITSSKDTTLQGVKIGAKEVNVETGGDFSLVAAESSSKESSSSTTHNAALAWSGGVGATGAGVGASYDYTGSTTSTDKSATIYTNSTIDADSFNVVSKGNMAMKGANVTADNADINVTGDLSITSVQDTSVETSTSKEWGASVGIAVSTSGVLPTVSINGGGGSEEHISNVTGTQSGIKTINNMKITTGGDLNLTGGHIISENQTGSVDVGGSINSNVLVDNVDSSGTYKGGGGGISYKGTPTANVYVNTLDEVHYKEQQNNTINVGISNGEVKGEINTDKDNLSTVTQNDKKAGNNISYTIGVPKGKNKKSKKTSDNTDTPANGSSTQKPGSSEAAKPSTPTVSDNSSSSTQKPGSSEAAKPSTPTVSDNSSSSTQKPGSSEAAKPSTPTVSDNSSSSTQKPGSSEAAKPSTPTVSDNSSSSTQKPGSSEAVKPSTPAVSDNSSSTQKPGSSEAAKPSTPAVSDSSSSAHQDANQSTDTVDSGSKKTKWPTVQPVKPIVGGPGSASRPDGNNHAGSAKPAEGSPKQNGARQATSADDIKKAIQPAKKWETVKPVRPIVGGPGSASRPGGVNTSGTTKPANNSPAQEAQYNKSKGSDRNASDIPGKTSKSDDNVE